MILRGNMVILPGKMVILRGKMVILRGKMVVLRGKMVISWDLPSGNLLHNYGMIHPFFMGKFTNSQ